MNMGPRTPVLNIVLNRRWTTFPSPSPRDAKQPKKNLKHQFPCFSLLCFLFLGSALGLGLISSTLVTGTLVSLVASGGAQGGVGSTLNGGGHLALLDLLDSKVGGGNGQDGGDGGGPVDLGDVGLGVTLLGGV